MFSLQDWRKDIPVLESLTYVDTAQRGLTPQSVTEAGCAELLSWQQLGRDHFEIAELRQAVLDGIAELLRVDASEIAVVGSTGQGLNIVAASLTWQPGDNVVVSATEHPSDFYPWTNLRERGVEVRLVPSPSGSLYAEDYAPYIDSHTRLVAASLVSFYPGGVLAARELADLAHMHGAYLVLDAIQAVGIQPVYPRELGADAVATAAYKGLMSAYGTGFLYVGKHLLPKLKPQHLYMSGVVGDFGVGGGKLTDPNYGWKETAQLYEPGGDNFVGLAQMRQALRIILGIGVEQIGAHVQALARQLADGARALGYLVDTPPDQLGSVVCLRLADAKAAVKFLDDRQIKASARRYGLRMALHGYNNAEDVKTVLTALAAYEPRR